MTDPDPLRRALDNHEQIPADVIPRTTGRPDKQTARRLLATRGTTVEVHNQQIIEDADGMPLAVETTTSAGTLAVSAALLGWTEDELADDNDDG